MRKISIFIAIILRLTTAMAGQSAQPDSSLQHQIMIIPYDPQFYLSDADHDIMEATKKEPNTVRESFRKTVDLYVQHAIGSFRPCISLLNDADSLPQLKEALMHAYSKTGYRYEKAMPLPVQKERIDSVNKALRKLSKENSDSRTANNYHVLPTDARYMNAVINKPDMLQELFSVYGTDIFVFLNQFEIKTNYKNCLDIANKVYQRELMIHFSVYDYTGRQLAGSYAMSSFPSDSNLATDIMKNCFPEIARLIAGCIP
jgi:hypothetical protein